MVELEISKEAARQKIDIMESLMKKNKTIEQTNI